jgi:hypothetical protein
MRFRDAGRERRVQSGKEKFVTTYLGLCFEKRRQVKRAGANISLPDSVATYDQLWMSAVSVGQTTVCILQDEQGILAWLAPSVEQVAGESG